MTSRKGKVEEEDFEAFVRSNRNAICQDIKETKECQARIQSDLGGFNS